MSDFIAFVLLIGFLAGGMILFIILASTVSARNGRPRVRMGGRGRSPGLRISSSRFRNRPDGADPGIHHSHSSWDQGPDCGHGGSSGFSDSGSGGADSGGGDCGGGGGGD